MESGFKLDFLFQLYATRTCTTLHCAWQDTASEDLGPWRAPETEPEQEDAGSSLGCGLKRIGQVEKCQNYSNLTSGYRHPRCKSRSCGSSSLLGGTGCLPTPRWQKKGLGNHSCRFRDLQWLDSGDAKNDALQSQLLVFGADGWTRKWKPRIHVNGMEPWTWVVSTCYHLGMLTIASVDKVWGRCRFWGREAKWPHDHLINWPREILEAFQSARGSAITSESHPNTLGWLISLLMVN